MEEIKIHSIQRQNDEKDDFIEFLHSTPDIEISSDAQTILFNFQKSLNTGTYLRISFDHDSEKVIMQGDTKNKNDRIIDLDGFSLILDPISFQILSSIEISIVSSSNEIEIRYSLRQFFKDELTCLTNGRCCSGTNCC